MIHRSKKRHNKAADRNPHIFGVCQFFKKLQYRTPDQILLTKKIKEISISFFYNQIWNGNDGYWGFPPQNMTLLRLFFSFSWLLWKQESVPISRCGIVAPQGSSAPSTRCLSTPSSSEVSGPPHTSRRPSIYGWQSWEDPGGYLAAPKVGFWADPGRLTKLLWTVCAWRRPWNTSDLPPCAKPPGGCSRCPSSSPLSSGKSKDRDHWTLHFHTSTSTILEHLEFCWISPSSLDSPRNPTQAEPRVLANLCPLVFSTGRPHRRISTHGPRHRTLPRGGRLWCCAAFSSNASFLLIGYF